MKKDYKALTLSLHSLVKLIFLANKKLKREYPNFQTLLKESEKGSVLAFAKLKEITHHMIKQLENIKQYSRKELFEQITEFSDIAHTLANKHLLESNLSEKAKAIATQILTQVYEDKKRQKKHARKEPFTLKLTRFLSNEKKQVRNELKESKQLMQLEKAETELANRIKQTLQIPITNKQKETEMKNIIQKYLDNTEEEIRNIFSILKRDEFIEYNVIKDIQTLEHCQIQDIQETIQNLERAYKKILKKDAYQDKKLLLKTQEILKPITKKALSHKEYFIAKYKQTFDNFLDTNELTLLKQSIANTKEPHLIKQIQDNIKRAQRQIQARQLPNIGRVKEFIEFIEKHRKNIPQIKDLNIYLSIKKDIRNDIGIIETVLKQQVMALYKLNMPLFKQCFQQELDINTGLYTYLSKSMQNNLNKAPEEIKNLVQRQIYPPEEKTEANMLRLGPKKASLPRTLLAAIFLCIFGGVAAPVLSQTQQNSLQKVQIKTEERQDSLRATYKEFEIFLKDYCKNEYPKNKEDINNWKWVWEHQMKNKDLNVFLEKLNAKKELLKIIKIKKTKDLNSVKHLKLNHLTNVIMDENTELLQAYANLVNKNDQHKIKFQSNRAAKIFFLDSDKQDMLDFALNLNTILNNELASGKEEIIIEESVVDRYQKSSKAFDIVKTLIQLVKNNSIEKPEYFLDKNGLIDLIGIFAREEFSSKFLQYIREFKIASTTMEEINQIKKSYGNWIVYTSIETNDKSLNYFDKQAADSIMQKIQGEYKTHLLSDIFNILTQAKFIQDNNFEHLIINNNITNFRRHTVQDLQRINTVEDTTKKTIMVIVAKSDVGADLEINKKFMHPHIYSKARVEGNYKRIINISDIPEEFNVFLYETDSESVLRERREAKQKIKDLFLIGHGSGYSLQVGFTPRKVRPSEKYTEKELREQNKKFDDKFLGVDEFKELESHKGFDDEGDEKIILGSCKGQLKRIGAKKSLVDAQAHKHKGIEVIGAKKTISGIEVNYERQKDGSIKRSYSFFRLNKHWNKDRSAVWIEAEEIDYQSKKY